CRHRPRAAECAAGAIRNQRESGISEGGSRRRPALFFFPLLPALSLFDLAFLPSRPSAFPPCMSVDAGLLTMSAFEPYELRRRLSPWRVRTGRAAVHPPAW